MSEKGAFGQGALRLLCNTGQCAAISRPSTARRRGGAAGLSVGTDFADVGDLEMAH